jgi:hypothetical protein
MPIDDELAQAKAMVESDERQRSAGLSVISELLRLCNSVPILKQTMGSVTAPLQALLDTFQKWRLDNLRYLIDVIIARVQVLGADLTVLSEQQMNFIRNDWLKLVLDGATKAQQTRARKRVERLAMILSHAYIKGENRNPDLTEEMMRVATGLDEDDVRVLAWLCDGMIGKYQTATGRVDHESANSFWGQVDQQGRTASGGEPAIPEGMNPGLLMTCCAKLQSFGLLVQVQQNPGKVSPATLPYSPLQRGYQFLEYIRIDGSDARDSS